MCVLIVSGIGGRPDLSSPDGHSGELMTFLASCPKRSLADDGRHLSNTIRVAFNGFSSVVLTGFRFDILKPYACYIEDLDFLISGRFRHSF